MINNSMLHKPIRIPSIHIQHFPIHNKISPIPLHKTHLGVISVIYTQQTPKRHVNKYKDRCKSKYWPNQTIATHLTLNQIRVWSDLQVSPKPRSPFE
ncbi:hypothetical protein Hanom_Chr08g00696311 [Helianthus anomalus]